MKETKTEIVTQKIKDKIKKGIWAPGEKIPGEAVLTKEFNVSRVTVRDALSRLCNDNLIIKKNGVGSFVADEAVSNKDKYILISVRENILDDNIGSVYRILLENIKEAIVNAGFEPYIYMEQKNVKNVLDVININVSEIAGVVMMLTKNVNVYDEIVENEIPIVSCFGYIDNTYYNVLVNRFSLVDKMRYLIDKYNFQNYLVVAPNTDECVKNTIVYNDIYMLPRTLQPNEDNIILVKSGNDFKDAAEMFKNKLLNLGSIPDAIIFTDDIIFTSTSKAFPELKDILSKTKIISQTNKERDTVVDFEICKVEFLLENVAEESIKLLEKLIHREYIAYPSILLDPIIVNEEILSKD